MTDAETRGGGAWCSPRPVTPGGTKQFPRPVSPHATPRHAACHLALQSSVPAWPTETAGRVTRPANSRCSLSPARRDSRCGAGAYSGCSQGAVDAALRRSLRTYAGQLFAESNVVRLLLVASQRRKPWTPVDARCRLVPPAAGKKPLNYRDFRSQRGRIPYLHHSIYANLARIFAPQNVAREG